MAQICAQCGKKNNAFNGDIYFLNQDKVLCYDCAKFIREDINNLYYVKTIEDFEQLRNNIIDLCTKNYNDLIVEYVFSKINTVYESVHKNFGLTPEEEVEQEKNNIRKQHEENIKRRKVKFDNLSKMGFDGYYEYKVISLLDESGFFQKNSGKVNTHVMTEKLNELGIDGWHLVTAYSNELGENAMSGGISGVALGINSTVDENILIFERFVRIDKEYLLNNTFDSSIILMLIALSIIFLKLHII